MANLGKGGFSHSVKFVQHWERANIKWWGRLIGRDKGAASIWAFCSIPSCRDYYILVMSGDGSKFKVEYGEAVWKQWEAY